MKNKGVRIIDLVVWICMLVLASLMLCAFLGCAGFNERVDRAITVAESAVDIANEARVASGEIRD
jgi:uncharacterized membrane protein